MQHTKLQEQMLHSCLAIGYTYLTHSYLLNDDVHLVIFTARCTLVQSAVLRSHVVCLSVCLSVCNVGEL